MDSNQLRDKSKAFALKCICLCRELADMRKEYIMSKQLFRSATSIGANIREGLYAQSKADFISKLSISLKEAAESQYWLELLFESNYMDSQEFDCYNEDCEELLRLLTSILKTSRSSI